VAAVATYTYPGLEFRELVRFQGKFSYPYVPGLLSFREIPLLLQAFERLREEPDVVLCDGQGTAHPRRFGLASHLGLWLNPVPLIITPWRADRGGAEKQD
jgi:deoxyribonuclease V